MSEEPPDRKGERPDDPERKPGVPPHQPRPKGREERDDEASEESFPSSDAPASGGPGI